MSYYVAILMPEQQTSPYEVNSSFQLLDVHCHKDTNLLTRNSEDSEENGYGKMLLNMCSTFGLCILNVTCKGDLHGRYTYVTGLGCSVIDYFIASEELYYELLPVSEPAVAERIESSHFPVELVINAKQNKTMPWEQQTTTTGEL